MQWELDMKQIMLDEEILNNFPYKPEGFFLDRLLEVDEGNRRMVWEMSTDKEFPLVDTQRNHEVIHPPHLPGGIILHLTGIVGLVAARYFLDVRFDEGWSGYGCRIHKAEFKRLVKLGPPMILEGRITDDKRRGDMVIVRYNFRFTQEDFPVYLGDQTAVYNRFDEDGIVSP